MDYLSLHIVYFFIFVYNGHTVVGKTRPHVIFILADDLGWNDLSYHGSDQIPTPNIDALAYNGVILNRYYTQPMCTPSRASLMTGKYSIHTGQHRAAKAHEKSGLPLSMKIMPEYFKDLGYNTHLVGKWHLGFYNKKYTPLQRGFDSHFGYWTGFIGYYDHVHLEEIGFGLNISNYAGLDLRQDYLPLRNLQGQYATDIFTKEAVSIIENNKAGNPMFLYLAHLATHSGNNEKLLEAPEEEVKKFSYIRNPARRTYAAMVSKLDQSVGEVIKALVKKNMLENSVIVFSSDNGPPNVGYYRNWGSCYPFRGQKDTVWEGGVRAPAVVWSPFINKPSRVSHELMHISDWLPTLLSAAGFDTSVLAGEVDGLDHWQTIINGFPGPREHIVIDIYNKSNSNCFILGQYKYIKGSQGAPNPPAQGDDYLNFDSIFSRDAPKYNEERIKSSAAWQEIQKLTKTQVAFNKIKKLRQESTVNCERKLQPYFNCDKEACLFDIVQDPCEQRNIAEQFSVLVSHIETILEDLKLEKYPEDAMVENLQSDPDLFNGTWSFWDTSEQPETRSFHQHLRFWSIR